MEQGQL